jgi:uncharacterized protein
VQRPLPAAILALSTLFPAAAQDSPDLTKRALAGDENAQQALGERYRLGIGVKQDGAQAVHFYKLAAEQGVPEAQFALAEMYRYGESGAPDYAEAARWYRSAAEQGLPEAQFNLGVM